MNKYQEALDRIKVHVPEYKLINNHIVEIDKHSDLCKLQELIDKETPMKVIKLAENKYSCQKCSMAFELKTSRMNMFVNNQYCDVCGQKLDWSVMKND